jgi:hypothetical protein
MVQTVLKFLVDQGTYQVRRDESGRVSFGKAPMPGHNFVAENSPLEGQLSWVELLGSDGNARARFDGVVLAPLKSTVKIVLARGGDRVESATFRIVLKSLLSRPSGQVGAGSFCVELAFVGSAIRFLAYVAPAFGKPARMVHDKPVTSIDSLCLSLRPEAGSKRDEGSRLQLGTSFADAPPLSSRIPALAKNVIWATDEPEFGLLEFSDPRDVSRGDATSPDWSPRYCWFIRTAGDCGDAGRLVDPLSWEDIEPGGRESRVECRAPATLARAVSLVQIQDPEWANQPLKSRVGEAGLPHAFYLIGIEGIAGSAFEHVVERCLLGGSESYRRGMAMVRPDRPQSLLPELTCAAGCSQSSWTAYFGLVDMRPRESLVTASIGDCYWVAPAGMWLGGVETLSWSLAPKAVKTTAPADNGSTSGDPRITGEATIRGLRTHAGRSLARRVQTRSPIESGALLSLSRLGKGRPVYGRDWWLDVDLLPTERALSTSSDIRIGAMKLTVGELGSGIRSNFVRIAPRAGRVLEPSGRLVAPADEGALWLHVKWTFNLDAAAVDAQDTTELEQVEPDRTRPAAVLIPLGGTTVPAVAGLVLALEELVGPRLRQRIKAEIRSSGNTKTPLRMLPVVVIDPDPFFVALVQFPEVSSDDQASGVFRYESDSVDGARWQLRAKTSSFDVVLPPQAIGESMVRRRQSSAGGETAEEFYSAEPKRFADFRLGPHTRLSLTPGFRREARSVDLISNLRRVLGDASQRAPGALVDTARFELFYGLSTEVKRSNRDVVLREITSDLGVLPQRIPEKSNGTKVFERFKQRWFEVHETFSTRLGAFSLAYREQTPTTGGDVASRSLKEGVSLSLRKTARIKPPDAFGVTPSTVAKSDLASFSGSPYEEDVSGGPPKRDGVPYEKLLAGGVDWTIPSQEIYKELWKKPKSNAASIHDVYLSALGGWGSQEGAFAEEKTRLWHTTAMGRTNYFVLERVGRIARWWNKAKHVIVYERTVSRSPQFSVVPNAQPPLCGRPILRKVREYIEILQPERRYPESTRSDAKEPGCVQAVEFKSLIIPVDSSWGRDVTGEGWMVPLWRENENADVYPRPHIEIQMSRHSSAGGDPTVRCRATRPQQFYFFTSTTANGPDTDKWKEVPLVDFDLTLPPDCDCGIPKASDAATVARAISEELGAPPSTEVGFEMGTFDIEIVGGVAVNLMAGRSPEPINAVLSNITMSRRVAVALSDAQKESLKGIAALRGLRAEVESSLGDARSDLARLRKSVEKVLNDQEVKSILEKIKNEKTSATSGYLQKLGEDAVKRAKDFESSAEKALGRLAQMELRELVALADLARPALQSALVVEAAVRTVEDLPRRGEQMFEQFRLELASRARILIAQLPSTRATRGCADVAQHLRDFDRMTGSVLEASLSALREPYILDFPKLSEAVRGASEPLVAEVERLRSSLLSLVGSVGPAEKDCEKFIQDANAWLRNFLAGADATDEISKNWQNVKSSLFKTLKEESSKIFLSDNEKEQLRVSLAQVRQWESKLADTATEELRSVLAEVMKAPARLVAIADESKELATNLSARLGVQFGGAQKIVEQWSTHADKLAADCRQIKEEVDRQIALAEKQFLGKISALDQTATAGLSLVRAFGEPPRVEGLKFNRPALAYVFDPGQLKVDMTPVTAGVNRVGNDLKALGINVPTRSLFDGIMPDKAFLEKLDFSKVFPDLAGIKLEGLLPDIKLGSGLGDRIRVRHGVDKDTRRGWLNAELKETNLGEKNAIFEIGPVGVVLRGGQVHAEINATVTEDARMDQRARGEIKGDWELTFGGQAMVVFEKTPLTFEGSSGIQFQIEPKNVKLNPPLDFLAKFFGDLSGELGGFRIEPLLDDSGLPTGVNSRLDIAIPPIVQGAWGVSGLSFSCGFAIEAFPTFRLTTRLGLGTRIAPFTITAFILGGGGWLEAKASYEPMTRKVISVFTLSIGASAMIGVNLGVIVGAAQVFFGVEASISSEGQSTTSLILVVAGSVTLIRILQVSMHFVLSLSPSGGGFEGVGSLSYSVKIGFWRRSISTSVSGRVGKGSGPIGGGSSLDAPIMVAAAGDLAGLLGEADPWLESLV